MTEQPEQNVHHSTDPAQPNPADQSATVSELVQKRLEESLLSAPVKVLLQEALGDGEARGMSSVGRIYLDSVAVTGFRGIGPRTWLGLSPGPA
ncbi:hypothetical protein OHA79_02775 [Streptomyces sp. NBC_00841]|uniref:hypothetical protein n=1 Tax=Streptomyces sp. NBC_00841 TaxID=2975847 RepID=UPI002DD930C7|nr:hypothetical protein [Streptomyces sp. NBC_00841]WRZ96945.1 hypothetical protein OHA79_02775 [Streptomyces sp. NBC_00841]